MIPNHYIKNGCFTRHPLRNDCLGYQDPMDFATTGFFKTIQTLWAFLGRKFLKHQQHYEKFHLGTETNSKKNDGVEKQLRFISLVSFQVSRGLQVLLLLLNVLGSVSISIFSTFLMIPPKGRCVTDWFVSGYRRNHPRGISPSARIGPQCLANLLMASFAQNLPSETKKKKRPDT